MKISFAKYILAVWFSSLLLLGNTPMEFAHLFANHKDTIHREHKGLVIEKKHHHCAFLSLTLTSFINDYQVPYAFILNPEYLVRHVAACKNYIQRCIVAVSLRGPPVA